jgi:hypothetical protein
LGKKRTLVPPLFRIKMKLRIVDDLGVLVTLFGVLNGHFTVYPIVG